MTVYTELLTIANRALRDKWFNGDDEKIRRCIAIIKLQQLTADRNTTGQLALTSGEETAAKQFYI